MTVATGSDARGFRRLGLTGGGPKGNEQLTASVSVVLLVALAVLGVTILRIGQLISVHLFVGMLLLGPVALKMASTGYRFTRYYTRSMTYRAKGPPEALLRAIAPVVVASTRPLTNTTTVVTTDRGGGSSGVFDRPRLPDHRDLDLPRIVELLLDLARDLV
jgi:hypothetical protein